MHSGEEGLAVAKRVQQLPGLRMDGLSGYEGHCSMEMDTEARHKKQAAAMSYFVEVADLLEANGVPCPILSAAGTATAFWTGSNSRITELQLGSYAAMDDFHFLMEPSFKKATSAVVTVISRRKDRVVLNLGEKRSGGRWQHPGIPARIVSSRTSGRIASTRSTRPTTRMPRARSRWGT